MLICAVLLGSLLSDNEGFLVPKPDGIRLDEEPKESCLFDPVFGLDLGRDVLEVGLDLADDFLVAVGFCSSAILIV